MSNSSQDKNGCTNSLVDNMLSVLIPAHNEENHIQGTICDLVRTLEREKIEHEVLVVNDNSTDYTRDVLDTLSSQFATLRYIHNAPPNGYGRAIKAGLETFHGECVAIVMADGSDDPEDLVRFYKKWREGYDCVFGNRFSHQSKVIDYPWPKFFLNRLGNHLIRLIFHIDYKDTTNAFKLYGRNVIADLTPLQSSGFNLTVEMPLKAIIRNYNYAVIPNSWYNRKQGVSKWKINETVGGYVSIIFYCYVEQRKRRDKARRSASKSRI